ncbi:hypothetical protein SELMODRAFT_446318 [Selaginella moellendorffii]|uniref:LysM domain-containing protein n=1 Tax=Selaginella moellendorffii TaxID=88036 RepID=D8SQE4_SELML|nr:protein OPAQUE10 isoform X1 [Selaginella moellendorffii]XP_024515244.1 protein OPAQUE10 isoform X1 [Selaginella moellendorffii]EFJ13449.1 hypothetical protein SELMODRAFT_446318 [Selaginella moellendorffii]|eukprot:XP_002985575.1 protein OPAQUE10 isoform X1 [Selaginella moellendorffii]
MAQQGGAGEMSPVQFRELDDEFMQKQAKVWLEALLEERYGGDRSLADLLADGDILFRVSKLFKDLIRSSSGGDAAFPRRPSSELPSNDAKGGRYLPYSHVDSFLKICKRIGLPDVDLFTPPDVVEKKDIRRVCFCIRALSKKARAQSLPVPDFDKVAHAGPMPPTDKVGGIREHLQQAAVASSSPDYKSPRTSQPIGKVLSSPSLAGSAFMETPPSIKQQESGTPVELQQQESGTPVKFEDETASSELQDEEDKQSTSVLSSQVDETEDDEGDNNPELVDEERCGDRAPPQVEDQQCCSVQAKEKEPPSSVQRNGSTGFVLPLVIGAVALVVSVLAVVAVKRPRKTRGYYVVKEGDTLAKISRTCGTGRWTELVDKNPGLASNPDLIYPTDRLKLA